MYRNEVEVGQARADSGIDRGALVLTTQLARADQGQERAYAAALESLARLGTQYVDLFLIHWPGSSGKGGARCTVLCCCLQDFLAVCCLFLPRAGLKPHDPENKVRRLGSWQALQVSSRASAPHNVVASILITVAPVFPAAAVS